jgi:hypothetical protein
MASPDDDIFINTGTTFQQQYVARVPAIGHVPASGQQTYRQPTVGQSHYTFAARNPFTYTRQGNRQTHYIANRQNPYPYIAAGQQPYIANRQNAYPYIANSQTPYIANRQNAYPYIANNQTPYIANAQTPFTYQRQNPFTYRNPVNGQQHYIANARQPLRQPVIGTRPATGNLTGRQPYIYADDTVYYGSGGSVSPSLRADYEDTTGGFGQTANAEAQVTIYAKYNSGNGDIEVWGQNTGQTNYTNNQTYNNPDNSSSVSSAWALVYKIVDAAAGYTVKYSYTNMVEDGGTFVGALTTSATAVPTDSTAKNLYYEIQAATDDGFEMEYATFDLTLTFEKSGQTTFTYLCPWDIKARATAES